MQKLDTKRIQEATDSGLRTVLPLASIVPDENQPRKLFEPGRMASLENSVKRYGIMNPIRVEKIGEKYLIEDGERRYRVAKEIGLKEVPVIILEPSTGVDRLIKQFHVQEQHEGWTATEKASVVFRLSEELSLSIPQMADLLALTRTTAARYSAYADLLDKKTFDKNEIGLEWAKPIVATKNIVRRLSLDHFEHEFDRTMEKKLENALIVRIKDGKFENKYSLYKVRDSFIKNPASVKEFIETNISPDELFIKTKARGAYHLRNIRNNAGFLKTHITKFTEKNDVKVDENTINALKSVKKAIEELLNKVE